MSHENLWFYSIWYFKSIYQKTTKKSMENKILGKSNTCVKERQAQQNSHMIFIISRPIHIPNLKSISYKTAEKSLEN